SSRRSFQCRAFASSVMTPRFTSWRAGQSPPAVGRCLCSRAALTLNNRTDLGVGPPQKVFEPRRERPAVLPDIVLLAVLVNIDVENVLGELFSFALVLSVRLRGDVTV